MDPTELKPVVDDVWRWSVWNEPRKLWFNGHLLRMGDTAVLVDPVLADERVAEDIDESGGQCLKWWCIVTNADHRRAALEARRRFGAQILVPRGDADRIDVVADDTIDDGDVIAELRVVRVPDAKTVGEIALFWPARKILVLGDAAIGRPSGALSMLADEKFANPAAARAAVAALAELGPDVVLVGDGDDVVNGGSAALAALSRAR